MALSGTGHISSQRMHGVFSCQGRHRAWSKYALPVGCLCFSASGKRRDGPRRADLAAKRAGVFAIGLLENQSRQQPRRKNAFDAGL